MFASVIPGMQQYLIKV